MDDYPRASGGTLNHIAKIYQYQTATKYDNAYWDVLHFKSQWDSTHSNWKKCSSQVISRKKSKHIVHIKEKNGVFCLEYYPSEPLCTAVANDRTVIGSTVK